MRAPPPASSVAAAAGRESATARAAAGEPPLLSSAEPRALGETRPWDNSGQTDRSPAAGKRATPGTNPTATSHLEPRRKDEVRKGQRPKAPHRLIGPYGAPMLWRRRGDA